MSSQQLDRQHALDQALGHLQAGRLEQAASVYRAVLARQPDDADALHLLGVTLHRGGETEQGYELLSRAASLRPTDPRMQNNLGELCRALGRRDEAIAAYRLAIAIQPDYAVAHSNLGLALADVARYEQAIECLRKAISLQPTYAKAHKNLGMALHLLGRLPEALEATLASIRLDPRQPETFNNLGNTLRAMDRYDDAIAAFREAIRLKPDYAPAHQNLGEVLARQGEVESALACYRGALELKPDYPIAWDSLLFTLHYSERVSQEAVLEEHRRWSQRFEAPLIAQRRPHANARSRDRRLRVGYVSPDFRRHPVGFFLRPLFEHHDRQQVELFAYATMPRHDAQTDFFKSRADAWRDAFTLTDDQLAEQVREDQIDVLVDTTLHMAHNRLMVFARKPAPVQITYLGYPHTTGLSAMDYKLTDPHVDPPGMTEPFHVEQLLRLPETLFCCDLEAEGAPDVTDLPARANGYVTFACSNTLMKLSPGVIGAWATLLARVEDARLLLIAGGLASAGTQQRIRDAFARAGVAPQRLELVNLSGVRQGLEAVARGDVALDTFPYSGGTTTCNSLWTGLPAITLAGASPIGRQGVSLLNNLGLAELVARDVEQYVDLAAALARDLDRLAAIRSSLRDRFRSSPITDGPRFARNVESVYRSVWQKWCHG